MALPGDPQMDSSFPSEDLFLERMLSAGLARFCPSLIKEFKAWVKESRRREFRKRIATTSMEVHGCGGVTGMNLDTEKCGLSSARPGWENHPPWPKLAAHFNLQLKKK